MRFESDIHDGVSVLRLLGRFATGSDSELLAVQTYLKDNQIKRAVLDLRSVPYIDSTGLAFFVELHKTLAGSGGQLFLAGANARIREVLDITRIREIIPLFCEVEEAESAIRGVVLC